MSATSPEYRASQKLTRAVEAAVIFLALVGLTAAISRAAYPADVITRMEPVRTWIFAALGVADPFAAARQAELMRVDGRYAAHPAFTMMHVVSGALLLTLAPLQFSTQVRNRHRVFHRWSGRLLIVAGCAATVPAILFGVIIPYAGLAEQIVISVICVWFLFALGTAFLAIRRGRVARHREWMIRVVAAMLAISTIRVIGPIADISLTGAGVRPQAVFVITVVLGWMITIGAAEAWIRHTRPATGRYVG